MRRFLRRTWARRPRMTDRWRLLLIVVPYAAIVLVGGFGLRANEDRIADRDRQSAAQCADRRDGRSVLRQVVIEATKPNSGRTAVDFAAVPGFSDLDASMQRYLENLGAALAVPTTTEPGASTTTEPSIQDRLLSLIPEITCPSGSPP